LENALELHAEVGFQQGYRETLIDIGEFNVYLDAWNQAFELWTRATDAVTRDDAFARVIVELRARGEQERAGRLQHERARRTGDA
jgi:hypothetical protein